MSETPPTSGSSSAKPSSQELVKREDDTQNERDKQKGTSCHQCKNTKPEDKLSFCTRLFNKRTRPDKRQCRKKYCESCLQKFYMETLESSRSNSVWHCPACRFLCCCAACTRTKPKKHHGKTKRKDSINGTTETKQELQPAVQPDAEIDVRQQQQQQQQQANHLASLMGLPLGVSAFGLSFPNQLHPGAMHAPSFPVAPAHALFGPPLGALTQAYPSVVSPALQHIQYQQQLMGELQSQLRAFQLLDQHVQQYEHLSLQSQVLSQQMAAMHAQNPNQASSDQLYHALSLHQQHKQQLNGLQMQRKQLAAQLQPYLPALNSMPSTPVLSSLNSYLPRTPSTNPMYAPLAADALSLAASPSLLASNSTPWSIFNQSGPGPSARSTSAAMSSPAGPYSGLASQQLPLPQVPSLPLQPQPVPSLLPQPHTQLQPQPQPQPSTPSYVVSTRSTTEISHLLRPASSSALSTLAALATAADSLEPRSSQSIFAPPPTQSPPLPSVQSSSTTGAPVSASSPSSHASAETSASVNPSATVPSYYGANSTPPTSTSSLSGVPTTVSAPVSASTSGSDMHFQQQYQPRSAPISPDVTSASAVASPAASMASTASTQSSNLHVSAALLSHYSRSQSPATLLRNLSFTQSESTSPAPPSPLPPSAALVSSSSSPRLNELATGSPRTLRSLSSSSSNSPYLGGAESPKRTRELDVPAELDSPTKKGRSLDSHDSPKSDGRSPGAVPRRLSQLPGAIKHSSRSLSSRSLLVLTSLQNATTERKDGASSAQDTIMTDVQSPSGNDPSTDRNKQQSHPTQDRPRLRLSRVPRGSRRPAPITGSSPALHSPVIRGGSPGLSDDADAHSDCDDPMVGMESSRDFGASPRSVGVSASIQSISSHSSLNNSAASSPVCSPSHLASSGIFESHSQPHGASSRAVHSVSALTLPQTTSLFNVDTAAPSSNDATNAELSPSP